MSVFEEIVSLVDKVYDEIKLKEDDYDSIGKKSMDNTAYFPIYMSDSIDLDTATLVTRALERVYGTFLISSMSLRNVSNDDNVADYIRKHHQNRTPDNLLEDYSVKDTIDELIMFTERVNRQPDEYSLKQVVREANEIVKSKGGLATLNEADKPFDMTARLTKNDVSKYNDMVPTAFQVTVFIKQENAEAIEIVFDMYVKAYMHRIPSESMVEHVTIAGERKRKFLSFVKATTGEMKFFRDYLLMISHSKKDAITANKKDSKQWSWLRSEKLLAKLKRFVKGKPLLPIATVCISQEEADVIKNEYNIDLESDVIVREIMEYYHLLGFAIIDMNKEISKFYYDGHDEAEEYTFKSLERENKKGNDYMKLTALLSKGGVL